MSSKTLYKKDSQIHKGWKFTGLMLTAPSLVPLFAYSWHHISCKMHLKLPYHIYTWKSISLKIYRWAKLSIKPWLLKHMQRRKRDTVISRIMVMETHQEKRRPRCTSQNRLQARRVGANLPVHTAWPGKTFLCAKSSVLNVIIYPCWKRSHIYRPPTKLRDGNAFSRVRLSPAPGPYLGPPLLEPNGERAVGLRLKGLLVEMSLRLRLLFRILPQPNFFLVNKFKFQIMEPWKVAQTPLNKLTTVLWFQYI